MSVLRLQLAAPFVAASVLLLAAVPESSAQYVTGTYKFNQTLKEVQAQLNVELNSNDAIEQRLHPNASQIATDTYIEISPEPQYTVNVIFDPCRWYNHSCCNGCYGEPEFRVSAVGYADAAEVDRFPGNTVIVRSNGSLVRRALARTPPDELFFDDACTGPGKAYASCIRDRTRVRPFRQYPSCWNYNTSIDALSSCRAPADGALIPLCMEIAITSNAYIVECGHPHELLALYAEPLTDYDDDPTDVLPPEPLCGTYLEIHRPGSLEILSSVRVKGMLPNGYSNLIMSTTYQRDAGKVLCFDPPRGGAYEVWWTQRTRWARIVQRIFPFRIQSPLCDWDAELNRYEDFATVATAARVPQSVPEMFTPARLEFTRPRPYTMYGKPGIGMGATFVRPNGTAFPPAGSVFLDEDRYTYKTSSPRPFYTTRMGVVEPPNIPPDTV